MPELRHLRYFVAVAEELNFSRAAGRPHMAQSPLSVAIRQLEDEIGAQLLQRTSREVRLTAAGRAALTGAYRTVAAVDRTMLEARRAGRVSSARCAWRSAGAPGSRPCRSWAAHSARGVPTSSS